MCKEKSEKPKNQRMQFYEMLENFGIKHDRNMVCENGDMPIQTYCSTVKFDKDGNFLP